jgi:hypothetical protein
MAWGMLTALLGAATAAVKPVNAPNANRSALRLYSKSLNAAELYSYSGRQYISTWNDDGRSTTVATQVLHGAPDDYSMKFLLPIREWDAR